MPALTTLQSLCLLFRSIETSPAAGRRIVQSLSCEAGIKPGLEESTSPPPADFMNPTFCRMTRIELSAGLRPAGLRKQSDRKYEVLSLFFVHCSIVIAGTAPFHNDK